MSKRTLFALGIIVGLLVLLYLFPEPREQKRTRFTG